MEKCSKNNSIGNKIIVYKILYDAIYIVGILSKMNDGD